MTDRRKAVCALLGATLVWSSAAVFVKYLIPYYDSYTQNVLRYASGAAFMLPLLMLRLTRDHRQVGKREMLRLLLPAIPNVLTQTTWVFAMKWLYPAFTSFLNKSSLLFAGLLALLWGDLSQ